MRLIDNRNLPLAALAFLLVAAVPAGADRPLAAPAAGQGPQADYPMLLGGPFVIDGVTYTPADTLNYDVVGYASVGTVGLPGVTASHRTLPLPSYVEITELESGRTILVRVERRGPMTGAGLTELSPDAATQLGITGGSPVAVRVRRVNPPEIERASLRAGRAVPPRMDTPPALLTVLKRRLMPAGEGTLARRAPSLPGSQRAALPVDRAGSPAEARPSPPAAGAAVPATRPGSWLVQVGAFASEARAAAAARATGGRVDRTGSLWRVRLTGFPSAEAARAALARVRAAGHPDAVLRRSDAAPLEKSD